MRVKIFIKFFQDIDASKEVSSRINDYDSNLEYRNISGKGLELVDTMIRRTINMIRRTISW